MHGSMNIKIRAFYVCSPLAVLRDILYKLWCCIVRVNLIAFFGVTMTSYYRLQQCCVKCGTKVHLSNCNVGSFAKLQKAIISFFMSVWNNSASTGQIFMGFDIWIFFKNLWKSSGFINPLKPELNPICYLLALLGTHHFFHVSRIRVKSLTLRLLMSYIYIYGAPILDVSRSHTMTQHSR